MVELADTLDLGSSAERLAGSSPVPGTISHITGTSIQNLSNSAHVESNRRLPAVEIPDSFGNLI